MNIKFFNELKWWCEDIIDNPREIYNKPRREFRIFCENFKRSSRWFVRAWNDSDVLMRFLVPMIVYKLKDMRYQFDVIDAGFVDLRHQPTGDYTGEDSDYETEDHLKELDMAIELGEELMKCFKFSNIYLKNKYTEIGVYNDFLGKIKHSTKWFFKMWGNQDYDYTYLIEMIVSKLKDIYAWYDFTYDKSMSSNYFEEMIKIGEKLIGCDYIQYSPKLQEWYDTHDIFSSEVYKMPDDIKKEADEIYAKANEDEKNDREQFFEMLYNESVEANDWFDMTCSFMTRAQLENVKKVYKLFYDTIAKYHTLWWS